MNFGSLPGQPQHRGLAADRARDVGCPQRAVQGILAIRLRIRGVASVNGLGSEPKPRRDEFWGQSLVAKHGPHRLRFPQHLVGAQFFQVRNDIVVVKLNPLKAETPVEG